MGISAVYENTCVCVVLLMQTCSDIQYVSFSSQHEVDPLSTWKK